MQLEQFLNERRYKKKDKPTFTISATVKKKLDSQTGKSTLSLKSKKEAPKKSPLDQLADKFPNEYVFGVDGQYVIDTKHAGERIVQRGTLTQKELETLYTRMIKSNPKRIGTYIFYSQSLRQGLVVNYRVDGRAARIGVDEPQFIIITFLPRGKHHAANPRDTKVMLESLMESYDDALEGVVIDGIVCVDEEYDAIDEAESQDLADESWLHALIVQAVVELTGENVNRDNTKTVSATMDPDTGIAYGVFEIDGVEWSMSYDLNSGEFLSIEHESYDDLE